MRDKADQEGDAELIERSARGDRAAFAVLVARHGPALLRFARTVCGADGADGAEDVMQETFVAAWHGAGGFRGEAGVRSWLFTIARNACHRSHRRRSGEPERLESLAELGREAGWGAETGDDLRERIADRELLTRALDALSPFDREAIALVDVEGLTAEEAAEAADVGVAALKSRLHRARLRLMAALRKESSDAG